MGQHKDSSNLYKVLQALVPFVAGAVLATLLQQAMTIGALQWSPLFLMLLFFCVGLISVMFFLLFQEVNEIRHSVGINVTYIERKNDRANLFKRAKGIIQTAQESILVVTSFMKEGDIAKDQEAILERDEYYDALIDKVIESKGKITYQRILQIKEGQEVRELVESKEYQRHLHRMLDEKEGHPGLPIGLLKVPAKRVTTFVLIDGKYLIWQINELIDTDTMRMHGIFIIEDPQKEITGPFMKFFEDLKLDARGAVRRDELPPLTVRSFN